MSRVERAGRVGAETGPLPEIGVSVVLETPAGANWCSEVVGIDGQLISLSAPRIGGELVRLTRGRELTLLYARRSVPCELDAVWENGPLDGPTEQLVVVRQQGDPRRLQRRDAVRVPVQLVVRATPARHPDGGEVTADVGTSAVTENLSAGGVLLRMNDPLEVAAELVITLQPPGDPNGIMDLPGRVVRCDRYPESVRARPWRIAIAFSEVSRAQQDVLMRYIFQVQREDRARERGLR